MSANLSSSLREHKLGHVTSRGNDVNQQTTVVVFHVMKKRVLPGKVGRKLCSAKHGMVGLRSAVEFISSTSYRVSVFLHNSRQMLD